MNSHASIRILRALFGLLTLAALARQLAIHLALGFRLGNFFGYYTILSNLFAGCVLLLCASITNANGRLETLRFVSVLNMTLVGIVFVTLLRETDLGQLLPWVNFVHHYLMPCVVLADWIITPPRNRLKRRDVFIALSFPLAYLVYSLIRGRMLGWYPYPFLDARIVGGTGRVVIYIAVITLAFCIVGSALLLLGNKRRMTRRA